MRKIIFIFALTISIASISAAFFKIHNWGYPAVVGVWLVFDYLSSRMKNKTTLDLLINANYKKFIMLYLSLAILGGLIEIIGNLLLNFWTYTFLSPIVLIISIPLFYPFILMSFIEMYAFINSLLKNHLISLLASMFIGIMIWEIPNLYSQDWIYTITFITLEVLSINIAVIAGWVLARLYGWPW